MTPEQRNAILGLAVGWSGVATAIAFIIFLFLADNLSQVAVYCGFFFVVAFAVIRWWMFRQYRHY